MPRTYTSLSDMTIDEVARVDVPAGQFSEIVIAKRATEEDTVPEYYSADGAVIDVDSLEPGDVVYDADGAEYEFVLVDEDEDIEDDTYVPENVGKAFSGVREDLAKAFQDMDKNEAVSKAYEQVSKAEQRAARAEAIAKAERDLRLSREYAEVAKNYGLPVDDSELGNVLMRVAEVMSDDDCATLHKALSAGGDIFREIGAAGMSDNNDPWTTAEAILGSDNLSKSDTESVHESIAKAFANDSRAYDEYVAGLRAQR